MAAALRSVEQGSSVTRASRNFGVPRSTLHDRVSGRVVHGMKPGPKPYLDDTEELELSGYLKHCAKVGYGKTRRDVLCIVESATAERGRLRADHVSGGWWRRFKERQGDLSLRQGDSTAHARMDAMNQETMDHYFSLLHDTLSTHCLLDKPSQMYNVDETGIPLNPRPPKVITTKGRVTKKVRYRTSGRKGQVTVVGCANASGQAIPPMIIYDAARLNPAWTKNEVPGTKYGLSPNGWINSDLFEAWFVEHFLEHAVSARPLFLLLDGHSTHYQPQVIRLAREHNCIMLCLPPHTTHEAQPLDVGVFAPLKVQWTKVCHELYQKHPGSVVTKFNFSRLFSQAWCNAVIPANVMSGFRKAGVYPFNPNAITIIENTSMDSSSTPSRDESGDMPSTSTSTDATTPPISNAVAVNSSTLPTPTDSTTAAGTLNQPSSEVESDFTYSADQEELNKRRYQEGYDLPDAMYEEWLKLHHPESSRPISSPILSPQPLSLSEYFSGVTPLTPVAADHSKTCCSSSLKPPEITPTSLSSGKSNDTPLRKHLVVPSASTPSVPTKAKPHARLLTSAAALELLEEKEQKKKKELELKEQRKREREENKRKREEDQKRKLEERVRKAQVKAKQKEQKTAEKAHKTHPRTQKSTDTAVSTCSTRSSAQPPQKKARIQDETIDENKCCVCFTLYDEDVQNKSGKEWVMCACSRWLHEECVEDCVLDSTGKERLCPLCLDISAIKLL